MAVMWVERVAGAAACGVGGSMGGWVGGLVREERERWLDEWVGGYVDIG